MMCVCAQNFRMGVCVCACTVVCVCVCVCVRRFVTIAPIHECVYLCVRMLIHIFCGDAIWLGWVI